MVPDQQAAMDFYRDLFGWQGEPGPPETGGYAVCTLNGKTVAGIVTAMAPDDQPTPPTTWTSYLATGDADATAQAIIDNGGSVLMPGMDVLTFGRMLVAADPTGAVFGVWQARDFIGSQMVNEPGTVIWSELNTTDPDAAHAFYPALGVTNRPDGGSSRLLLTQCGGPDGRRPGPAGRHVRSYQPDRSRARLNRQQRGRARSRPWRRRWLAPSIPSTELPKSSCCTFVVTLSYATTQQGDV